MRRRADDVMRSLLTGAVAVAYDPSPAPCRSAERLEERGAQLKIGLDRVEHRNILTPSTCPVYSRERLLSSPEPARESAAPLPSVSQTKAPPSSLRMSARSRSRAGR